MRYLLLLLLVAACAETEPPPDACGASGLTHLVGRDMSALAAMTFPDTTRFISPGDAVTMDFNPERLNFDLAEDGTILRLWCG